MCRKKNKHNWRHGVRLSNVTYKEALLVGSMQQTARLVIAISSAHMLDIKCFLVSGGSICFVLEYHT